MEGDVLNDKIKLGNYKGKDLYWIPVYTNDPRYYILEEPICKMPFDMGLEVYKTSYIRKYITEDFIPNAFSQEDLQKIVPIADKYDDYASLITQVEMLKHGHINHSIYKYKKGWWLFAPVDGFPLTSSGVMGFLGMANNVDKSCKYGVRPYIILNL